MRGTDRPLIWKGSDRPESGNRTEASPMFIGRCRDALASGRCPPLRPGGRAAMPWFA